MLIHWDLKLFVLFVLMNNSFVLKNVAVEVAVVDSKVPNIDGEQATQLAVAMETGATCYTKVYTEFSLASI